LAHIRSKFSIPRAVHPDERLSRLADLLGHLEQAYLDPDVPLAGMQIPDLVPHSSRQLRVSEIRAARRHAISMKVIMVIPRADAASKRRRSSHRSMKDG
jgi:hypothetical protein